MDEAKQTPRYAFHVRDGQILTPDQRAEYGRMWNDLLAKFEIVAIKQEPDLYEMAQHAYEKVLNVSLLLDEIQMKIPHDRPVLYERGKTAQKTVGQALNAVYAVIAEISKREQPTLEQGAQEQEHGR